MNAANIDAMVLLVVEDIISKSVVARSSLVHLDIVDNILIKYFSTHSYL